MIIYAIDTEKMKPYKILFHNNSTAELFDEYDNDIPIKNIVMIIDNLSESGKVRLYDYEDVSIELVITGIAPQ